jgi:hypothetical protein
VRSILFNLKKTAYYLRKDFFFFLFFILIGLVHGSFFSALALATNKPQGSMMSHFYSSLFLGFFFLDKSGKVATIGIPLGFILWGMMLSLWGLH